MANLIEFLSLSSFVGAAETVIVDARSGPDAARQYQQGHLPGAVFVDVETDLSSKKSDAADGGRHPLPNAASFSVTLQRLGITPSTTVIIYDNSQGANAAARFWWMLRAFGHHSVFLTNGDLNTAIDAGFPLESGIVEPTPAAVPYPPGRWQDHVVDMQQVRHCLKSERAFTGESPPKGLPPFLAESPLPTNKINTQHLIIDVRESERYQGLREPIDLVAGHIPGAINIPWRENIDAAGKFRDVAELKTIYSKYLEGVAPEKIIVHCGSGVSACHTLFAFHLMGLEGAKLYVGSWSEWSRNNNPMVGGGDKP